jgi:hypothetical protein
MSKKNIHSSIFEFILPLKLGFGYCKILDFRSIREFDGLLVKVFDYIVEEPIKEVDILKEKDWLFGARRMAIPPNTKGKGAWKIKGTFNCDEDIIIPEFKDSPKLSPLVEDESVISEWHVIKNIREVDEKTYSYEQVKHLENTFAGSQFGIEIRTAMEFYRQKGVDVKKYFDLDDMSNWNAYRTMVNMPVYSAIPKEIRGKAIR